MTSSALSSGPRLPASILASLALHGAALGLYLYTAQLSRNQASHVIGNVDLMIQVHKPAALPNAPKAAAAPPDMMHFLKMALPAIPKIEAQKLEVKIPAHELKLNVPKLEERARRAAEPKLDALKLDDRRPEALSALDVGQVKTRRSVTQLAALPKLEEVGRRQVRNLPAAIKLDEERQQAAAMIEMKALTTPTHRTMAPMGEALQEAEPSQTGRFAKKLESLLPTQPPPLGIKEEMRPSDDLLKKKVFVAPLPKRDEGAMMQEKKKGVELEGPIKNRKITNYEIPPFPPRAKELGILEAAVAIRFWVSPEGDVEDNMRVESTSGFGWLDRTAMDSLKNWKFAPLPNDEKQWGVITFRFVLE